MDVASDIARRHDLTASLHHIKLNNLQQSCFRFSNIQGFFFSGIFQLTNVCMLLELRSEPGVLYRAWNVYI